MESEATALGFEIVEEFAEIVLSEVFARDGDIFYG